MKIGVGINLKVLEILSKYLSKDKALEVAKKIEIEIYVARQSLKETIIRDLNSVMQPEYTFPGSERLPANTIGLIDEKYDYKQILNTPIEDIEFLGIPAEY